MEIIWTDKAIESYSDIVDYSLVHFGRFSTIDLTKRVDAAIAKISKYPSASPLVNAVQIENVILRYVTIKGPLQLIYKEGNDVCTIVTVWNTKKSPKTLLKLLKS